MDTEKFIKKKLLEIIKNKPKDKKEEQKQMNAILFYLKTKSKNKQ